MSEQKSKSLIDRIITYVLILASAIAVYYANQSEIDVRVSLLEAKNDELVNTIADLTKEVKKQNENNRDLTLFLTAKFGEVPK